MSDSELEITTVRPVDEYNQRLVDHVHPDNWLNPQPAEIYDLVIIGAGPSGLVVAAGAAGLGLGLKVALVEKNLLGGDCLNVGCIPSKALLRSARVVGEIRRARDLGINVPKYIDVDFPSVMERLRRLRTNISENDSAVRFKNLGVDVFFGHGRFVDQNTVEVEGKILKFKKAVIATGTKPIKPNIPGIEAAGYLTNETVFSLIQRPQSLAIVGAGLIGCELAQAFQRLGSQVTLFQRSGRILTKEDSEAASVLQKVLVAEGVRLVLNSQVVEVHTVREGKQVNFSINGVRDSVIVDDILVSIGRKPNLEELNLAAVGVNSDRSLGVKVNDYLQTTNPKIYAAGDICMNFSFTHAADAMARIVIKNTLFAPFGLGRDKLSNLVIPWVIYTDPEIAQVGMNPEQAKKMGIEVKTIRIPLSRVDRAIVDGEELGFLKIYYQKGSDLILGATIVANHAGEMISEITTAMVHRIGLGKLSSVIHPYPTQGEAIKKAADSYRKTLLTPRTQRILEFLTKLP
jgi:dihydrolipoamide dehydrogenase